MAKIKALILKFVEFWRNRKVGREKIEQKIIVAGDNNTVNVIIKGNK